MNDDLPDELTALPNYDVNINDDFGDVGDTPRVTIRVHLHGRLPECWRTS